MTGTYADSMFLYSNNCYNTGTQLCSLPFIFNIRFHVSYYTFFYIQAELMKKKLPWLEYDMKKMEYKEAQKHEAAAKKNMQEAAKLLNDLKAPIE